MSYDIDYHSNVVDAECLEPTYNGIEVTRREFGWSVEGGQPVSVEAAINLVEIKRRLRE